MNSSNLINPLSVHEHAAWRRWLLVQRFLIIGILFVLIIISVQYSWHLFVLQKKITLLQKSVNVSAHNDAIVLQERQIKITEDLKDLKQWTSGYYFQDHVETVAKIIPAQVSLFSMAYEEHDVVMKGQTVAIEFLLDFIYNLEQSLLFQAMNIIELQPSLVLYEEKKLVNFTIKGKLNKVGS